MTTMSTTVRNTLMARKGRVAGLVTGALLGLSLLGGGLLAQGRLSTTLTAPAASSNPFAGDTHVATQWDYREDHRAERAAMFIPDQFTYREDRRGDSVLPAWVPDFWTYREDHRASTQESIIPDQFSYREDHRGEVVLPVWVPDFWTYREDPRER